MVTSVKCRPRWRQKGSRSAPTEKCPFAALLPLLVLLAGGVPALAADSIEDLLQQQDETDSHNDALRRDLNALTEEQWQYYFKVERKQPDIELGGQLIARENEERPRVLYIWVAAVAAALVWRSAQSRFRTTFHTGGCVGRSSPVTLLIYLRPRPAPLGTSPGRPANLTAGLPLRPQRHRRKLSPSRPTEGNAPPGNRRKLKRSTHPIPTNSTLVIGPKGQGQCNLDARECLLASVRRNPMSSSSRSSSRAQSTGWTLFRAPELAVCYLARTVKEA